MFRTQRLAILLLVAATTLGSFDANATDRYVRLAGRDYVLLRLWFGTFRIDNACHDRTQPCHSVVHAIDMANSNDLIKVAQGSYGGALHKEVDDSSRYLSITNLVVQGGWSQDFATHGLCCTTIWNVAGPHTFHGGSSVSGILDLTFKDLTFWFGESSMQITSGNVTNTVGTYQSWMRKGQVTLTLRNVSMITDNTAPFSINATSGRFSTLTLNLVDVVANGIGIKATSRSYTGPPSLADPDWSVVTLNVRRSEIKGGGFSVPDDVFPGDRVGSGLDVLARGSGARAVVSVKESNVWSNIWAGVYAETEEGGSVSLDIENSFLVENEGFGLEAHGGVHANVRYSTISRNESGGILTANGADIDLMNTIVWGNEAIAWVKKNSWDLRVTAGTVSASYSDVGSMSVSERFGAYEEGPGVVDLDPRFVEDNDPNLVSYNDFHLKDDSPLIDRGICGRGEEYDFDGEERPLGRSCEIGADEVRPALNVNTSPFQFNFWSWSR